MFCVIRPLKMLCAFTFPNNWGNMGLKGDIAVGIQLEVGLKQDRLIFPKKLPIK